MYIIEHASLDQYLLQDGTFGEDWKEAHTFEFPAAKAVQRRLLAEETQTWVRDLKDLQD